MNIVTTDNLNPLLLDDEEVGDGSCETLPDHDRDDDGAADADASTDANGERDRDREGERDCDDTPPLRETLRDAPAERETDGERVVERVGLRVMDVDEFGTHGVEKVCTIVYASSEYSYKTDPSPRCSWRT